MKKYTLTKAELDTMQVLWKSDKPLSIKEMPSLNPKLNANTAAVAIKNLLKKEMVQVSDITYHGTALTRLFEPKVSKSEYYITQLENEDAPIFDIVSSFVKNKYNAKELEELEELIKEQKRSE